MGSEDIDLSGQVALVTGGGRGLGRAFAQALASAGASVAVMARSEDQIAETVKLIESEAGEAMAISGDVTERSSVESIVNQTEATLGPIDILVNNAGIPGAIGKLWELDPADWWTTLEVNLQGVMLFSHAVLGGMVERKSGRVINVTSGLAHSTIPNLSAYSASKAGLTHFTRCLANETKEFGISVFAYNPGLVRTPGVEGVLNSPTAPDATKDVFADRLAQGLDVPILESAARLMFLASGKADAFTGKYISATDDESDLLSRADEIQQGNKYTLGLLT